MGKIRCKTAARNRRSDENELLQQLSDMLPLNTCKNSMDKASVVRLSTAYIRLKEIAEGFERESSSDEHKERYIWEELTSLLLQCLDGFLLIVGLDGKTIYVSETVIDHLGLSQIEMTGDLIYGYIHPEDKSELESLLTSSAEFLAHRSTEIDAKIPVIFPIRMKCSLSKRFSGFAVGGHKIIHCSGYLKFGAIFQSESDPSRNQTRNPPGCGLIMNCHSFPSSIETGIRLFPHMFMFRLSLDFTITYADGEVFSLTGYEPSYLKGKKLYKFLHLQQIFQIQRQHTILLMKGQAITPYYAFLTNGGGWIWMQSYFVRTKYGKPPRDSIVACNYVISERQHVDLVINEEQRCMLNCCCKVSEYTKSTTSPLNNVFSKGSNYVFKCSSGSAVNRQSDNTFTSTKTETLTEEKDVEKKSKQIQSRISTNLPNRNYRNFGQLIHLSTPLTSRGNEELCSGNFMSEELCDQIGDSISKSFTDRSSPILSINSPFQKIGHISKTCDSLKSVQQIHNNAFIDIDKKSFNIDPHFSLNLPCPKEIRSLEFRKYIMRPASFDSSISHPQRNNQSGIMAIPKLDGDILHPVLEEMHHFPKEIEQTMAVSLSTKTGVNDSLPRKSESILKTLLLKSPDKHHSSSSKGQHSSSTNSTVSYHKRQLVHPTYSELNLELPSTHIKSLNSKHPKLLSPVSETAMDFNCLQIRPTNHFENDSSTEEDVSSCSREFLSTSTCSKSNIRKTSPDISSANAKRIRSDYNCIENNNSIIDYSVPLQKPQSEINNNQLHSPGNEYNFLLGNTIVGSNTKFYFGDGQLGHGIQTSAILEKENLTYNNYLPILKTNKSQTYENNSLCHSLSPPWITNKNFQHQYSERKVLSLKQELDLSDSNKNVTKVLSSNVILDQSDINTYFPNQSFEKQMLSSRLELYRTETEEKCQSPERKSISPGFKSPISSHCNNHSQTSFSKDFNEDDFSEIKILDLDSDPDSLFSSVTFENVSQLVSDLSNALNSTLEPETSDAKLIEDILRR